MNGLESLAHIAASSSEHPADDQLDPAFLAVVEHLDRLLQVRAATRAWSPPP